MHNLRFALRTLRHTPIVSLVAILSLGVGIGANTAIFALFDQVLLRSLPATNLAELVNLTANGPRGGSESIFSYPLYRDLERVQTVFSGIAAHRSFGANLAYQSNPSSAPRCPPPGCLQPRLLDRKVQPKRPHFQPIPARQWGAPHHRRRCPP